MTSVRGKEGKVFQNIKTGQKFTLMEKERVDCWKYIERKREYEIKGIYPYLIYCIEKRTGFKRCFNVGQLIMMGMIRQENEVEALRMS